MSDPAFTDGTTAAWEPGVVVGIRRWRVSPTGELLPLTLDGVPWYPGLNTAGCASVDPRSHLQVTANGAGYARTKVADPACRCGFYAFHRPDRWRWNRCPQPLVEGVIAASGNATIGRRGFRAQHARVVALHIPARAGRRDALCRTLRIRHTGFAWAVAFVAVAWALLLTGVSMNGPVGNVLYFTGFVLSTLGVLALMFGLPLGNGVHHGKGTWPQLLAQQYPDVPVYRTRAAMLAEHPLSGPPDDTDRNIPPTRKEPA